MRKIPVFVSCPTSLTTEQDKKRDVIINILEDLQLEPRALGRGDYPKDYPLKEVYIIAKHCADGSRSNQSAMPVIYRMGDVYIMPSLSETWGMGVNEAMASDADHGFRSSGLYCRSGASGQDGLSSLIFA